MSKPSYTFTVHLYREYRTVTAGIVANSFAEAARIAIEGKGTIESEPMECDGVEIAATVDIVLNDEHGSETITESKSITYYSLVALPEGVTDAALQRALNNPEILALIKGA